MALAKTQQAEVTESASAYSDDALRGFVGYQLKRAFNVLKADLAVVLDPLGLRLSTYSALVLIDANPGIRQADLAALLSMERPNMVLVLDDLENRGLITRERDESDRRAYALTVTLAGKRICTKVRRDNLKAEERRLRHLNAQERETLQMALQKLEQA